MTKPKSKSRAKSNSEPPVSFENFVCTTAQVGQFFGITPQRVNQWVQQLGCPKLGHGSFDLKAVFDWWIESDMVGFRLDESSGEIKDARLEYYKWQAEEKKVKTLKLKEELLSKSEVEPAWASRCMELATALDFLEHRISSEGAMKSREDLRAIIRCETRQMRANYCREGRFCEWKDMNNE